MTKDDFIQNIDHTIKILERERKEGRISGGKVNGGFVDLEIPSRLAIVSDLHGDLTSLLSILDRIDYKKFLSDPANKLIFLGDYVDRGSQSVEILYIVCQLKRRFPDSVILMRGNHEAPAEFPFSSHDLPHRIIDRFGDDSKEIYSKVLGLFGLLSLAILVENTLLIVHGGLPTSIKDISNFRTKIGDAQGNLVKDRILEELLWNDPRLEMADGSEWEVSRRGIGKHFGKKISRKWLDATGAKIIVRGHEPCMGFRIDHDGMVLTLFSCKEAYPRFEAAYIELSAKQLLQLTDATSLSLFVNKIKM